MPQPFTPPKYCPKCHTELVKDAWDEVVHLETAQEHCPELQHPDDEDWYFRQQTGGN